MKKIIAMLLALTMVLALAACGGDPKETTPGNDPIQQTTPVEDRASGPEPHQGRTDCGVPEVSA